MLTGLNHLTLTVTDLQRSFDFYKTVLGFRPRAKWDAGAYLSVGDLWLCLSAAENKAVGPSSDYTHFAFSVPQGEFHSFVEHVLTQGALQWKTDTSEGDSCYLLDPDGHKLEVHVGSLETRLAQCRKAPYAGMAFF